MNSKKTKKGDRHWYDYLWIASMTYLIPRVVRCRAG